jgi:hypothetical protein
MTTQEILNLGIAIGFAASGNIDAAVHSVLPGTLVETNEKINQVFGPLFTDNQNYNDAEVLLEALHNFKDEYLK